MNADELQRWRDAYAALTKPHHYPPTEGRYVAADMIAATGEDEEG